MRDMSRDEIITSYYRVRQALGYLGLSLPLVLILGGMVSLGGVEPSISDYYHTVLRDVFVGIMCAISIFLITYPGHRSRRGDWVSDDTVTTVAGVAGFGVAFFPNEGPAVEGVVSISQMMVGRDVAAFGHYFSAMIFLASLGYICLVKFARTARPFRRRIYRGCGWVILSMTVLVVVASVLKIWGWGPVRAVVVDNLLVLWFEAIAVWAFSLAWLTKGRADQSLARLVHPTVAPPMGGDQEV
jgi:hypothetical protein